MYVAQLEKLRGEFPDEVLEPFDQYIGGLSPAARNLITKARLLNATQVTEEICDKFLKSCVAKSALGIQYAIRCPECSLLLDVETNPTPEQSDEPAFYCSDCNEVYSANDILKAKSYGEKFYALQE